jgi:hypothetical protein
VFSGIDRDGTVRASDTAGFLMAVFSYRPDALARARPIMDQNQTIADALPHLEGANVISNSKYKYFRWNKWDVPRYVLRSKDSFAMLRQAFLALQPQRTPGESASRELTQAVPPLGVHAFPSGHELRGKKIGNTSQPRVTSRNDISRKR